MKKNIFVLFVSAFCCSIFTDIRGACIPPVDFSEDEYKVISMIISTLKYDVDKDKEKIRKLPLHERFIWNAFIWRLYKGNNRNGNLYFTKLSGIEFDEITLSAHKEQLLFFQRNNASDLVLDEFLSTFPPPSFFYSDVDLLWVEKIFLKTKLPSLRDNAFYILVTTKRLSSKSDKKILETLSQEEMDRLKSFEERSLVNAR